MEIGDEAFKKLFMAKERLCCAGCGSNKFDIKETGMSNTTIEEAVFMTCKICGHKRLELV